MIHLAYFYLDKMESISYNLVKENYHEENYCY